MWWGFGNIVGDEGLYELNPDSADIAARDRIQPGEKWVISDPVEMTGILKKAAIYIGSS